MMLIGHDRLTCSAVSKHVQSDLKDSGLIANDEKCQYEPCQIIEWLGLVCNAVNSTISLTDRRMSSMSDALHVSSIVYSKNDLLLLHYLPIPKHNSPALRPPYPFLLQSRKSSFRNFRN